MKRSKLVIVICLFFSTVVYSQNIIIKSIDYDIIGKTQKQYIEKHITLTKNQEFITEANFLSSIANTKQELINLRIFDSVDVTYTLDADNDGFLFASILITLKDTHNFLIVPYPKYDSNEGLILKTKIRDANLFGTISCLNSELAYVYTSDKDHKFSIEEDLAIPFYLNFIGIEISNKLNFGYLFISDNLEFDSMAKVKLFYPITKPLVELSYYQLSEYGQPFTSETYWKVREKIELAFPFYIHKFLFSVFSNVVFTSLPNYLFENNYGFSCNYSLINWKENFRSGFYIDLINFLNINYTDLSFDYSMEMTAITYNHLNFMGINAKFSLYYNPDDYILGDSIRGIKDSSIYSNFGLFLNLDLPITIIKINQNKVYDFEMQLSPFIDLGYVNNFIYSVGIEFLVFPRITKSIQLRASCGITPTDVELFIGIGLFY